MSRMTAMILPTLLLGACSWMHPKPASPPLPQATVPAVIVFREPASNSATVPLYFGEGDQVYLALDNGQYGTLNSTVGWHHFVISAKGGANFEMDINIQADTITCIRAYADPANNSKAAEPASITFTNIFKAETVPCPPNNTPVGYKRIGTNS